LEVRIAGPADAERVHRFFERLSPESVYRRFFTLFPSPPAQLLNYLAAAETEDHESLAALDGDEIVALASWDRRVPAGDEAELAILVEDSWQHRGLGRALIKMLTAEAARHGVTVLTASVLSDNQPARRLAIAMAHPEHVEIDGPETRYTYGIAS